MTDEIMSFDEFPDEPTVFAFGQWWTGAMLEDTLQAVDKEYWNSMIVPLLLKNGLDSHV